MTRILLFSLLFALMGCSTSKKLSTFQHKSHNFSYLVDLKNIKNDQVKVVFLVQGISEDKMEFCLPKIVPGIYGAMDFGQYISNLKAYDASGKEIRSSKEGTNCWSLEGARNLAKIEYWVDDTWDVFDMTMEENFYRSAGSSFSPDHYVLNNNCLLGYLKGHENKAAQLSIQRPAEMYGATSLQARSGNKLVDVFEAKSYHELVDSPILYAKADTSILKFPDIEVEIAVYSSSGTKLAKELAEHIRPLIENQRKYLGGKLPVKNYSFLLFHNLNPDKYSYLGDGLEHQQSTLILLYMPLDLNVIKGNVYGIASHEFIHTIMPLGIHSEEIANYNYNDPKFSRHIWLYEGMTEYFTIHMPIKNKVQQLPDFFRVLQRKIKESKQFDKDLSLTELSLSPMDKQDQYYNVYLKGTLTNMCLDIELRDYSKGEYGVQDMVAQLLAKYGPDRAFKDDEFFEEIIALTKWPGMRNFIEQYIEGTTPLPLKDYFERVGFKYNEGTLILSENEAASAEQLQLRKYWIDQ
ncbi:MAG: hypothetical protein R8P61_04470 [Bacteroidia bacterium]|nr:hypothetical protein [Bacteroidia bacterium]